MARNETKEVVGEDRSPILGAVRKVLLASVGAAALAQDEVEDFVNKLVERGEIAEKEGKGLVRDAREKRRTRFERAEKELDQRIEELLHRMNVPTKSDLDALEARIAELAEKIAELNRS
jgi:polyhydroxyalkanoate synthesis regulator phasin